ncbi:hypothetical protein HH310_02515 [Actinoplanes sp. TBRC 11911]|uniref:hypothetical protein n=1 Tax=Actinoplanes sp. TBRC 11911 TaxID=2729386 RepID=UPI00145EBDB0|nr:hypothetical protein [Actinoplanes sp. TBRC 11911]NMO50069.1 hypothetical protein [Actinoplanes sp. TBRC 11911]
MYDRAAHLVLEQGDRLRVGRAGDRRSGVRADRLLPGAGIRVGDLITETIGEGEGEHNTSLHNMLRLGFTVADERQRWIFHT